ncbi:MAG: J domain-containing protein [Xanthobacteraceae bacterium]
MVELGSSQEVSLALVNAILLALWPVLPALLLGYARKALAVRHARPEFSLRKSEALELDRAVRLYENVRSRLKALERENEGEHSKSLWEGLLRQGGIERDNDEADDLHAHAQFLRETIVRLKRRPLQRLKSWMHLISSKSALGRGLAAHVVGFALLLVIFRGPEQPAWADEVATGARTVLAWYPFDARFFYANAVATGFAAAAVPLFYLARWIGLRREYGYEFSTFRELARSDPGQLVDQLDIAEASAASAPGTDTTEAGADGAWYDVLGLPSSATIEQVKEAFKRLVKQNHPDRLHDMSPALRALAETETKRLNAVFRQALIAVSRPNAATN